MSLLNKVPFAGSSERLWQGDSHPLLVSHLPGLWCVCKHVQAGFTLEAGGRDPAVPPGGERGWLGQAERPVPQEQHLHHSHQRGATGGDCSSLRKSLWTWSSNAEFHTGKTGFMTWWIFDRNSVKEVASLKGPVCHFYRPHTPMWGEMQCKHWNISLSPYSNTPSLMKSPHEFDFREKGRS